MSGTRGPGRREEVLMSVLLGILFLIVVAAAAAAVRSRGAAPQVSRQPGAAVLATALPGGLFLDVGHTWMHIQPNGSLRIGVDGLIAGLAGRPERVELPPRGGRVERGSPLITIRFPGERRLVLRSPVEGQVLGVNSDLEHAPWLLSEDPYGLGWAVALWCRDHQGAIAPLRLGSTALAYLRQELQRAVDFLAASAAPQGKVVLADGAAPLRGALATLEPEHWREFEASFLERRGSGSL